MVEKTKNVGLCPDGNKHSHLENLVCGVGVCPCEKWRQQGRVASKKCDFSEFRIQMGHVWAQLDFQVVCATRLTTDPEMQNQMPSTCEQRKELGLP